jgi:hypothetical protein
MKESKGDFTLSLGISILARILLTLGLSLGCQATLLSFRALLSQKKKSLISSSSGEQITSIG